MRSRNLLIILFCTLLAPALIAQVTTGNLSGVVTVQADGSALPGVTIEAVHTPTGTRYDTVSRANGRYFIPNVRVGGPYRITATLEGFRPTTVSGIQVSLGTTAEVPVTVQMAAVSEAITVTATLDEIINPNRTGSSSAVSTQQIETLPTVNRTFQDFARTNPYFNIDADDPGGTRMSVAGRSERYNTIQIDGAVNNDLFGLSDSTGAPGGRIDALPISLEALQQIQLVVSPYDVRQGGFTGGGVNAVSRSGTNDYHGSFFYTKRDKQFIGDGPFDTPFRDFDHKQYGGRVGGRIIKDRLFFFVSGESGRRSEPTGGSADGSTGTVFRKPADAARLRDFVMSKYNYDPGTLGDITGKTDNDTLFARFDWNANNANQLTLRHNYVDGMKDQFRDRTTAVYRFPAAQFSETNKTNSTVLQINSVFGASAFNEGRVGYETVRDQRTFPVPFPTVEIGGTGERRGELYIGTEQFSGANRLNQDILELTDDFTWTRGNHSIVFGTHNEFFDFMNIFLSERFGFYYFPTLADFEAGKATVYRISYGTGNDPLAPAKFAVRQYGLYVNDQWHVNPSLTLTFGLRGDKPTFPDTPSANPLVVSSLGLRTDQTASESVVWSPRFGFNWTPGFGGNQQLRGGVGVFAGRTPYVWIANIFANTGVEQISLGCVAPACTPPPFNADPLNQPRSVGSGGAVTVNLLDPDFTFPRILRATLGYDRDLIFGIRGTIEGVWSRTQKDIFYFNANRVQSGTSPLDGRPTYTRVTTQLNEAPVLTNTDEGEERLWTIQFNRPFANHLTFSASYANQDTESAFDTTSSRAISSFQFNPTPGDIFKPHLARSFFETEHRFNTAVTYSFSTGPLAHNIGLFYTAQTARPYSLLMGGDPNRDGFTSNDLLFVPGSDFILCPSNATAPAAGRPCGGPAASPIAALDTALFRTFLESVGINPTAGRILNRNELTEPWSRELDFHYELGLPTIRSLRTEITADVLNVLNMIDKKYGNVKFVSNQTYTSVNYQGQDSATGKPIYREAFAGALTPGRQFNTADLRSRWQAKLGLRVTF